MRARPNPCSWAAVVLVLLFASAGKAAQKQTITFPSRDGLTITADLYLAHKGEKTPFIVLFHQAGRSRGEYVEIAPRLNKLGFNCMAVDQRSGFAVNGINNATAKRAKAAGKSASYVDVLPDMRTAMRYVRKHYAAEKLIAWGSSYSAALVLKLAGDEPGLLDGVVAFSPGEYFQKFGKSSTWIQGSAAKIEKPVFITSAKGEKKIWCAIFAAIPSKKKVSYLPRTKGNHGSRALWAKFKDHEGYWKSARKFLRSNFP